MIRRSSMKLLLLILFIPSFALAASGQTYATATIQVFGVPDDNTTLTIGPFDTAPTFEFSARPIESGNDWIDTYKKQPIDHIEPGYGPYDIALLIQEALRGNGAVNCEVTFDGVDTLTVKAGEIGAAGNSYLIVTDSTALVVTPFAGGTD